MTSTAPQQAPSSSIPRTSARLLLSALLIAIPLILLGCSPSSTPSTDQASSAASDGESAGGVVNVYSARHYDTDDEVYTAFREATGIEVNVVEGDSAALLERLRREGEQSPADVFLAVDAGRLHQAQVEGIFQPIESELLEERVPENLRSPEALWFGLTKRARVIAYAKDRVDEQSISSYEDLADPRWRGKVLVRSSSNIYNQSLVGSLLESLGEEAAEQWCEGLVANFARKPQGGDRDQVRAVVAGEGDVAVVNSYYLAQMLAGPDEDRAIAERVGVVFPNQGGRGTHVNLSGGGVVRGAPNRQNAIRLLEFLTSEEAQRVFAGGNKEYPVVPGYPVAPELVGFGDFEEDQLNAAVFGANNQRALELMDRCGWR